MLPHCHSPPSPLIRAGQAAIGHQHERAFASKRMPSWTTGRSIASLGRSRSALLGGERWLGPALLSPRSGSA